MRSPELPQAGLADARDRQRDLLRAARWHRVAAHAGQFPTLAHGLPLICPAVRDDGTWETINPILLCAIAIGREAHQPSLDQRFAEPLPPKNPTSLEAMAHRLGTPEGKKHYAWGKQTPETVFVIMKWLLGVRQFLLRGLDEVRGEWDIVTLARNMKRMVVLTAAI